MSDHPPETDYSSLILYDESLVTQHEEIVLVQADQFVYAIQLVEFVLVIQLVL